MPEGGPKKAEVKNKTRAITFSRAEKAMASLRERLVIFGDRFINDGLLLVQREAAMIAQAG